MTNARVRRLSDETRRALLAERQLLGSTGREDRAVLDVAEAVGPLHSTDPSSAYLQIAARALVSPEQIDGALYEDRMLLRHTTLRRTVHLLTHDLAVAAHGAYNHRLAPKLRTQLVAWLEASEDLAEPAGPWLEALEDEVVVAVGELDRPSGSDLSDAVPGLSVRFEAAPGKSYSKPQRITSKVLELLIADGRIARDRPRGNDFTSGAWTYGPVTKWLPDGLGSPEPAAALADLLRARLASLPGASVVDLAWWTGLPKGQVRAALSAIDAVEVAREDEEVGFVLPDDELTPSGVAPGVSLLPGLDATPMSCKQRGWFLGEHEEALFDRSGNIGPTLWWGGRVVGGWTQREDGEVVVRFLENTGQEATSAAESEAARLGEWLGEVRVRWRYPTPLQKDLEVT